MCVERVVAPLSDRYRGDIVRANFGITDLGGTEPAELSENDFGDILGRRRV